MDRAFCSLHWYIGSSLVGIYYFICIIVSVNGCVFNWTIRFFKSMALYLPLTVCFNHYNVSTGSYLTLLFSYSYNLSYAPRKYTSIKSCNYFFLFLTCLRRCSTDKLRVTIVLYYAVAFSAITLLLFYGYLVQVYILLVLKWLIYYLFLMYD